MVGVISDGDKAIVEAIRDQTQDMRNWPPTPPQLGTMVEVLLLPDTSALADGDLASNPVMIPDAAPYPGATIFLQSVNLIDEDDQGLGLDLVIMSATGSLGTVNSAPNATDLVCRSVLGWVRIGAGDYIDLGGSKVATLNGLGMLLKPLPTSKHLWVGSVSRGAPTYTREGLRAQFGFVWV